MRKALVRFSYIVEVEISDCPDTKDNVLKKCAITNGIVAFKKEFENETVLDIAHALAPDDLSKVKLLPV